jgi:hypothetical protein
VRKDEEDDSPVFNRSSVPPTICLTFPSCRSMHGRNWDLLRGDGVVLVDIVYWNGDRWEVQMLDGHPAKRGFASPNLACLSL